ncbi:hypothetical protein Halru_0731 [Halovivax ruber XH-70]|uniref:Uncharacterized protein n=1 Tax=Halovivax ruber (strain DSM 18193 / JCM 13892 / XH-70) TaxID=797302 RepID=L0I977_HALRX|nr:hypothetical protein [Halovivax ruber]AGB15358.1 hypothetical protein Halru_0731 [Halovivax ruber XH-70]
MVSTAEGRNGGRLRGLREYLLLRMNRWLLSAVILLVVYAALVLASRLGLTPLRQINEAQGGMGFFFTAFIGAIITGTSIVVTINQLVLSQELGAVGDQRDRMDAAMTFQRDVEESIGIDITEPEPSVFVRELLAGISDQAGTLQAVGSSADADARDDIDAYATTLGDVADQVHEMLASAQFGTFDVIWVMMHFEYSRLIHQGRSLRDEHELPDDVDAEIDTAVDLLTFFGPTREHFKTLYFQWELINLSRALLYASIPALTVMAMFIMYVDAGTFVGSTLGVSHLVWVVSAGVVVGFSPFVIFITFIVRIVTVAKRTLAMGPFILRETEQTN